MAVSAAVPQSPRNDDISSYWVICRGHSGHRAEIHAIDMVLALTGISMNGIFVSSSTVHTELVEVRTLAWLTHMVHIIDLAGKVTLSEKVSSGFAGKHSWSRLREWFFCSAFYKSSFPA